MELRGAEEMELREAGEMELRGAGAPAAGQRLLQADAPAGNEPEAVAGCGRCGGAGNRLRSFVTVILCASFLGLVRTGAEALPGRGVSRRPVEKEQCKSRLPQLQTV